MPTLLTIPFEIRDTIIDLVIYSKRAPPENPGTPCDRAQFDDIKYHACAGDDSVKYEANPDLFRPNSLGLLLTDRQLSVETTARLERMQVIEWQLDVMLVNESELWPTWTYLPRLKTEVDTVTATFRAFGQQRMGRRNKFRCGDGSPPLITWCFYSLLERFVRLGPIALRTQEISLSSTQRHLTVKTLTLDFLTVTPTARGGAQAWSGSAVVDADEDREYGYSCDPPRLYTATPEKLCGFLSPFIDSLLSMGYHTAEFGMLLYERIGKIRISVDGHLQKQWDLGELLAVFPLESPSAAFWDGRQADFTEWRKKVMRVRRQARLPVSIPVEEVGISGS